MKKHWVKPHSKHGHQVKGYWRGKEGGVGGNDTDKKIQSSVDKPAGKAPAGKEFAQKKEEKLNKPATDPIKDFLNDKEKEVLTVKGKDGKPAILHKDAKGAYTSDGETKTYIAGKSGKTSTNSTQPETAPKTKLEQRVGDTSQLVDQKLKEFFPEAKPSTTIMHFDPNEKWGSVAKKSGLQQNAAPMGGEKPTTKNSSDKPLNFKAHGEALPSVEEFKKWDKKKLDEYANKVDVNTAFKMTPEHEEVFEKAGLMSPKEMHSTKIRQKENKEAQAMEAAGSQKAFYKAQESIARKRAYDVLTGKDKEKAAKAEAKIKREEEKTKKEDEKAKKQRDKEAEDAEWNRKSALMTKLTNPTQRNAGKYGAKWDKIMHKKKIRSKAFWRGMLGR